MGTSTYIPLANITLGSSAASVTFSSISQAYRDLVLVVRANASTGSVEPGIQLNSDTGNNYAYVTAYGDGGSTGSFSGTTTYAGSLAAFSTVINGSEMTQIMDYSATDKHKTMLHRWNRSDETVRMTATRWANTAAVTTVKIGTAGTFAAGSIFALYGIAS